MVLRTSCGNGEIVSGWNIAQSQHGTIQHVRPRLNYVTRGQFRSYKLSTILVRFGVGLPACLVFVELLNNARPLIWIHFVKLAVDILVTRRESHPRVRSQVVQAASDARFPKETCPAREKVRHFVCRIAS